MACTTLVRFTRSKRQASLPSREPQMTDIALIRLALACASALLFATEAGAQAAAKPPAPTVYTVGKGETVMTIANKLRYPSASENQMAYAIVRKNPNAFSARSKERLKSGAKLVIPDEKTVLSYKPEVVDPAVAKLRKGETRYQ